MSESVSSKYNTFYNCGECLKFKDISVPELFDRLFKVKVFRYDVCEISLV